MKKIFKISISVMVVIALIFSSALAGLGGIEYGELLVVNASAVSEDGLTFALNDDACSYSVVDCDASVSGDLTIPATYDGLPVTGIGDSAFASCTQITSVTIPDCIKYIGRYAFYYCAKLTSVTVPGSVDEIGAYAFQKCDLLTTVELMDGVESIGDSAFSDCAKLTTISIPETVTQIGYKMFYCCTSLENVRIPGGVTSVGGLAFFMCSSLTSIVFPATLESIGTYAFYGCSGVTSVSFNNSATDIGDNAFYNCDALENVKVYACSFDTSADSVGSNNDALLNAEWIFEKHTESEWVVEFEPTCDQDGSKHIECSVCRAILETEVIPALGHSYSDEWTVDIESSLTNDGEKSRHCLNCSARTDITIIPRDINDECVYVDTDGLLCNDEITYIVKLKGGVGVQSAVIGAAFDPDVLEPVEEKCGPYTTVDDRVVVGGMYEQGFDVNADNVYVIAYINMSAQTFAEDTGFIKYTFKVKDFSALKTNVDFYCVEFIGDSEIEKNDYQIVVDREELQLTEVAHTPGDWVIDVEPTCTEEGSKSHHCTACGEKTDVTVITATGHSYVVKNTDSVHPHTITSECLFCNDVKTETQNDSNCYVCIYGEEPPVEETPGTEIDYTDFVIRTDIENIDEISDILGLNENATVTITPSYKDGDIEIYGTGSVIAIYDGEEYIGDFTLVVNGDTNGDGVCDALDAAQLALVSNGHTSIDGAYAMAADGNGDDEIGLDDYQAIVNKMVA